MLNALGAWQRTPVPISPLSPYDLAAALEKEVMRSKLLIRRAPRKSLLRHTRLLSRTRDQEDPLNRVETTVRGVLFFFRRFLNTVVYAGFRPRRFGNLLLDPNSRAEVVGPYTFLTVIGFYTVKLFRLALILVFVIPIASIKGCEAETTGDVRWPSLFQLFSAPSVDELILIGLPVIGVSIAIALLMWKLLAANHRNRSAFVQAVCYCFGLELLLLLPACVALGVLAYYSHAPNIGNVESQIILTSQIALAAITAGLVLWPSLSIYKMFDAIATASGTAHSRSASAIKIAIVLACLLMAFVGLAMSYPAARTEFFEKYRPRPLITLTPKDEEFQVTPNAKWVVAIGNNTDRDMQFRGEASYVVDPAGRRYDIEINDRPDAASPLMRIRAREQSWFVVTVGAETGWKKVDYFFLKRIPPRICLELVEQNPQGSTRRVCAWVGYRPLRSECPLDEQWLNCAFWYRDIDLSDDGSF
jgi:hypothetical protein